jgi:hypothetical protein
MHSHDARYRTRSECSRSQRGVAPPVDRSRQRLLTGRVEIPVVSAEPGAVHGIESVGEHSGARIRPDDKRQTGLATHGIAQVKISIRPLPQQCPNSIASNAPRYNRNLYPTMYYATATSVMQYLSYFRPTPPIMKHSIQRSQAKTFRAPTSQVDSHISAIPLVRSYIAPSTS